MLEKAVSKVKGVAGAQADFLKSSLRVEYAPEQVQPGEIIQAIEGAGYAVAAEVSTAVGSGRRSVTATSYLVVLPVLYQWFAEPEMES